LESPEEFEKQFSLDIRRHYHALSAIKSVAIPFVATDNPKLASPRPTFPIVPATSGSLYSAVLVYAMRSEIASALLAYFSSECIIQPFGAYLAKLTKVTQEDSKATISAIRPMFSK
jgi:hypothetical protein